MATNRAAWILGPRITPFAVEDAELPQPGFDEVVIKNHAVGINPIDFKVQDWGLFLQTYPNIMGMDVAGEVFELGDGVSHVRKGDRVIGQCISLVTNLPKDGAFQLYTTCNSLVVAKIPSSLPYTSAAVLPVSISTAAECLFKKEALALPFPSTSPQPTKKSVLVWGGSGSVGASAVQLAVAAGVKVISVSSEHNIARVKDLGAAEVFDYHSATVAEDIISALQDTEFVGICDCIGTIEAVRAWTPVYKRLGGRHGSVLPGPAGFPEDMEGAFVHSAAVALTDRYVGEAVWRNYIPEALEEGVFRAKPDPTVIPGGLEMIQEGVNRSKDGLSFGKIVVEL